MTAKSGKKTASSQNASDIPLAQPDRTGPKAKTLLQLAEERGALLSQGTPFKKLHVIEEDESGPPKEETSSPFAEAVLYSISLSMLNFTLNVLVYHQYMQSVEWPEIYKRVISMLPVLFVLVYVLHSASAIRLKLFRQLFFFVTSLVAGCYMVHSANKYHYFAVMKKAPPIGTLWIWSAVEMDLLSLISSTALVAVYTWYRGYSII